MTTSKHLSSRIVVMWSILGLFLILTAVGNISAVEGRDDLTAIRDHRCGEQLNPGNEAAYLGVANQVLDVLAVETSNQPNFEYKIWNTDQGFTVYGYANCEGGYTAEQCWECVNVCANEFYAQCGAVFGAEILMTACYMRYENYRFF